MEQVKICRICLAQSVFSYSLLEDNGSKMLESLTSQKVDMNDNLPKNACVKCWLKIKLAYNIQQDIIEASKRLEFIEFVDATSNIVKTESIDIKCEIDNSNLCSDDNILNAENATSNELNIDNQISCEQKEMCNICGTKVETNKLMDHIKTHYNSEQKCEECNLAFKNLQTYTNHNLIKHKDTQHIWKCEICLKSFFYKPLYNIHISCAHLNDDETATNNLESLKRKLGIKSKQALEILSGQAEKNKRKPMKIPIQSNYVYDSIQESDNIEYIKRKLGIRSKFAIEVLTNQSKDAPVEQDFQCSICDKKFTTKRQIQHHTVNVHETRDCPVCGKKLKLARYYPHVKNHSAKSLVCHLCGVTAKNKESFKGHLLYTHATKYLACEYCGKTFKKMHLLNLHIKKHKGEKNHVCNECGKKFLTFVHLDKHKKCKHLKLRPHECTYCKKKFSSKYSLKTHERQHTNETPYKCELCGEGFRQNVSLKSHLKSKHNIEEVKNCACNVCGKMFASEHAVESHMRLHI